MTLRRRTAVAAQRGSRSQFGRTGFTTAVASLVMGWGAVHSFVTLRTLADAQGWADIRHIYLLLGSGPLLLGFLVFRAGIRLLSERAAVDRFRAYAPRAAGLLLLTLLFIEQTYPIARVAPAIVVVIALLVLVAAFAPRTGVRDQSDPGAAQIGVRTAPPGAGYVVLAWAVALVGAAGSQASLALGENYIGSSMNNDLFGAILIGALGGGCAWYAGGVLRYARRSIRIVGVLLAMVLASLILVGTGHYALSPPAGFVSATIAFALALAIVFIRWEPAVVKS